eukprot:GHVL01031177.1.p2 GENE.GHVL01031177.1~~GHVL01031177.1.p2  ORF type:complete len:241 (+),score=45.18 GHVL01031177.1:1048-1770(+)
MSPNECRILLQVQLQPSIAASFNLCKIRLSFRQRCRQIIGHDLKCSGGGKFCLTERNTCVLWNLAANRYRGSPSSEVALEATLLGELVFDSSTSDSVTEILPQGVSTTYDWGIHSTDGEIGGSVDQTTNQMTDSSRSPHPRGSDLNRGAHPRGSRMTDGWDETVEKGNYRAEVYMELDNYTLSGLSIDPNSLSIYPHTKLSSDILVKNKVVSGKFYLWNSHKETIGGISNDAFDDCISLT